VKGKGTHASLLVLGALALLVALLPASAAGAKPANADVDFYLTVLHNNDGESQVVDAGSGLEDFGGAARFKAVVDDLKWEATHGPWTRRGAKRGVVMLSSGDNFLAGPEFTASLSNGIPFYDTIAMELIGYDAVNLGNHDFDFGPDVLADFLAGFVEPPPYVSANLDFSGEPVLQAYVDAGVIAPATIVEERGERIGVIGINTPNLPFNSSPRDVIVDPDVVGVVQMQVDHLTGMGIDKIILTSHLQNISNEMDLACEVEGLDVIIAGGGDELLANPGDLLLPGDEGFVYGAYPQVADCGDHAVPVVTTSGEYRYVGRLVVGFDKSGDVVTFGGGPVRVATGTCNDTMPCDDAVMPDPEMQMRVVDPVEAYLADLGANVIATSEVALDGLRSSVRSKETNEGNLITDALLWSARELAATYGVPEADAALQNGGGIRNNTIIPAGPITELDTFGMVPFPNFLTVSENIPREQFKEILENAVACTQSADFTLNPNCGSGRFPQIAGFHFEWSAAGTGMIQDIDGTVLVPGTRVLEAHLDDGTPIVAGGMVVSGPDLTVATIDFLAKGGDQYPYRGAPFTILGLTQQQVLADYLVDGLGGVIPAADYPEGGEGRIVNSP
jgi:5'-nucleotidase